MKKEREGMRTKNDFLEILAIGSLCVIMALLLAVSASAVGDAFGTYEAGTLTNGFTYWLAKPSEEQRKTAAQTASMTWSGNYNVPRRNEEGTSWRELYAQRLYASDGKYVVVTVGNLPSTMPTVNVGLFASYDTAAWVTVGANTTVIFSFGERTDAAFLRVNTAEDTSAYANFKILTTDTNPAAGYVPPAPEAPGASDWARAEVAEAIALGFVPKELQSGYQQHITRAEFTKVALSFAAMEFGYDLAHFPEAYHDSPYGAGISQTYGDVSYTDMPSPDEHIWWGTVFGIVNGRGDGTFGPEAEITRQEAAAMLSRTYDLYRGEAETPVDPATYADMDAVADWARPSVDLMSGFGVMGGIGKKDFDPSGGYTREQCMVTFLRLYKNMPVSRSRGNVTPLYSYETEKARTRQGYFESWSLWGPPDGNDAFECCYVDYGQARAPRYVLYILYSAGGCRVAEVPQVRATTATYSDDAKTMYLWYGDGSKYALDIATGQGIS